MSRIEADKEDLIRDGTALVHRGEFVWTAPLETEWEWQVVTVGFRRDGAASFYFNQDPFYQFESNGLLRRAHCDGFLYRSQSTTLARLDRTRTTQVTTLQRQDLSPQQLAEFHERMLGQLQALHEHLQTGTLKIQRMVCSDGNLLQRVLTFLPLVLQHKQDFLSTSINQR